MREVARVVEGELGAAPGWILGGEDERKTPKNEGEAAEGFDFEGTLTSSRGGGGDVRGEGKNTPLGPTLSRRDVRGFAYVIEGEKTKNPSSSRRGGGGKGGGKGGKGGRIVGALFAEPLSRARWTRRGGGGSDDAGCVRVASEDPAVGWARATIGVRAAWTHPAHRRSGVARTLLEVALRETVAGGYVCDRGECAFSQPTVDGARFAARTCGRADGAFLVYDA
jgi:N-acetyltransferase